MAIQPGTKFGDFEIVRPLSSGGMGEVYLAKQEATGHERALKVMHARLAADPQLRERFVREARVGASIDSEHVVQVLAAGVDASTGTPWLAMELLRGEDLASYVDERGALSGSEVATLMEQVGHALSAAHQKGIVHRDLKPENVFVSQPKLASATSLVKVLDFGIAKVLAEATASASMAIGSPFWMAPEQATTGEAIRPSTDVWALGLIAFYLLTGKPFWRAAHDGDPTPVKVLKEMMFEPIPAASQRAKEVAPQVALPAGFDAWFARCVVREARERYRDATECVDALLALLGDEGKAKSPRAKMDATVAAAPLSIRGATAPAGAVEDTYEVPKAPVQRIAFLFGGVVLAFAVVAGGMFFYFRYKARSAAEAAFSELSQCLLGAPTKAQDVPYRMRALQHGAKRSGRGSGGEAWPRRCQKHAAVLAEATLDAGYAKHEDIDFAEVAADLSKALEVGDGVDGLVARMWKVAEANHLDATARPAQSERPPEPATFLTIDDLEASNSLITQSGVTLKRYFPAPITSEIPTFMIDHERKPFICAADREALRCTAIPTAVVDKQKRVRLIGSNDPEVAPLLLVGEEAPRAVHRSDDGGLVTEMEDVYAAYHRRDGAVIVVGLHAGQPTFAVQRSKGGAIERRNMVDEVGRGLGITLGEDATLMFYQSSVALVRGHLASLVYSVNDGAKLVDFPIGPDGWLERGKDIGKGDKAYFNGRLSACSFGAQDSAVIVRGETGDNAIMLLRNGAEWTPRKHERSYADEVALLCMAGRAASIAQDRIVRCSPKECASVSPMGGGELSSLSATESHAMTVGLSSISGIRTVLQDEGTTTDRVVFDDRLEKNKLVSDSLVRELRVVPGPEFSVLLLNTDRGLGVAKITNDGGIAPLPVRGP